MGKASKITKEAASRIQSTQAKKGGGNNPKGSFAARAQKAADKITKDSSGKQEKE